MSDVLRVGLVSCSKAKLDRVASAQDLYSPSYVFRMSRRYVEMHCDIWWVLSAKHGLVHPLDDLAPYDETLATMPKQRRLAWTRYVQEMLSTRYARQPVRFIVLAGRLYAEAIETLDFGEVEQPLRGLSTGKRRQWLAQRVDGVQP